MSQHRLRPLALLTLATSLGLIVQACAVPTQASPTASFPAVGEAVPAFTLPSATGGEVSSSDLARQNVLLYFSMADG
jgi:hypothetical protein